MFFCCEYSFHWSVQSIAQMRKAATTLIFVLFIFVGLAQSVALAWDDPMKGPWYGHEEEESPKARPCDRASLGTLFVRLYREYISPIDGSDCPMYPSCSQYSIASFEKHGFLIGWMMTWDRLYRCGRDELKLSPWILKDGESKCYDPVESNDFWFSHEE